MSYKPLDCVGVQTEKNTMGKHDFREHPDRPLRPIDKLFMQMMAQITGCNFIDVTPEKEKSPGD